MHPDTAAAEPNEQSEGIDLLLVLARVLRHHRGLVIASTVALLFPAKLLRVAHGDLTGALALLESSDKTVAASAVLVLALPTLVVIAWLLTAMVAGRSFGVLRHPATSDQERGRALAVLVLTGAAAAVTGWMLLAVCPWPLALGGFLLAPPIVAWDMRRCGRRKADGRVTRALQAERPSWRTGLLALGVAAVGCLLVVDLALSPILNDRMWLPARLLAVDSRAPATGYVVARDDEAVTVLWNADRRVERVSRGRIRSDTLCELHFEFDRRSFWDLTSSRPPAGTPAC